ncbi:hypothetical protein F4859DRAFT_514428 [Xylaria cf. heliscus]|nr:hypothetical protein F4859DRAFT_514428 [Xylaria cf. heliscus]
MEADISPPDECFEVREAGDGKGLGCFATRDIKPGETVLVVWTSIIHYDTRNWTTKVNSIIGLYESLDISDKREWGALHAYYNEGIAEGYKIILASERPDGTYLTADQQEEYLHLLLAFDNNCFGTDAAILEASVMFPEASRFNHSCDPNLSYECNTYPDRWIARANRDIATGEELTITYIASHSLSEERQADTSRGWGFNCACPKCSGGPDDYTASLERARDIVNGLDGSRARPTAYGDDIGTMAKALLDRVTLLRDIVSQTNASDENKWRSREFAMALWDASTFHRRWCSYWMDEGNNKDEGLEHSKLEFQYAQEAMEVAKNAWSRTHEIYNCLRKDAKKSKQAWDDYMKDYHPSQQV